MAIEQPESSFYKIARQEHAKAWKEYCATLTSFADEVSETGKPVPDLLDRIQAAKLRLDNARVFLELCAFGQTRSV